MMVGAIESRGVTNLPSQTHGNEEARTEPRLPRRVQNWDAPLAIAYVDAEVMPNENRRGTLSGPGATCE
jgi:hypothetical protein